MAHYRGLPARLADAALERLDLADRGDDRFKSYSLGMKQRLGVAAALMGDPDLIVLDEPTNGLDPAGMADMRMLIVGLAKGGQTVLLSSHLLTEVEEVCDRVGVISGGRLLVESAVDAVRGGRRLRIVATPVVQALAIATRLAGAEAVQLDGDAMLIDVVPERTPEVVRALDAEGLDVYEATVTERRLEDVFLEISDPDLRPRGADQVTTRREAVR